MIRIIIFVLVILVSTAGALNNTITLAWDVHADPNVIGYNLYTKNHINEYYRFYSEIVEIDLPDWLNPSVKIFSLDRNLAHYFTLTAFTETNESGFSNEVIYVDGIVNNDPIDLPTPHKSGGGGSCFISVML